MFNDFKINVCILLVKVCNFLLNDTEYEIKLSKILETSEVDSQPVPDVDTSYKGFNIGEEVKISTVKNIIISYDGKPEGFDPKDIGKVGKIIKFDYHTKSQKNVFIEVEGEIIGGDYQSLTKI